MPRLVALFLLFLGFALPARAEHVVEPPLVPAARPALVAGELTTARFRILYTRDAAGSARALATTIEASRDQLASLIGRDWQGVTEVRLGRGRAEFEALALTGGAPPRWATALAYPSHNIVLLEALSLTEPAGAAMLKHELSHVALGRLGDNWPRWFQEGFAVYVSGEHRFRIGPYATLFRAVNQNRIFEFDSLVDGWPNQPSDVEIAYAQSSAFIGFIFDRHPAHERSALFDAIGRGEPFQVAFAQAFRTSLGLEEEAWKKELPSRYAWLPSTLEGTGLFSLAALLCFLGFLRLRTISRRRRRVEAHAERAADANAQALGLPPVWEEISDSPTPPPPAEEPPTLH